MMHSVRRICYVSGTRADFGLMQSTLVAIDASPKLALDVVVTGMHLSERFGFTVREIEAAGLNVAARIPVNIDESTGAAMARNLAMTLAGCVDAFERLKPDIVLLLGDRGEMLAGALAAIHLNVPVVHIHGGERSGTVDEPVRHAITKLSHWHCVATEQSRERLVRMGEDWRRVVVTGAPGLDGLRGLAKIDRDALCAAVGFDPAKKTALFVFHPVLHEAPMAGLQASHILHALMTSESQTVALMPNADAGGDAVRATLAQSTQRYPQLRVLTHLPRSDFISWMAACDIMIGNSSSGIIEAATFGTPVINVGARQNLRERNANVTDVEIELSALVSSIALALARGRFVPANVYGDGNAGERIVELLLSLELTSDMLSKTNAY